MDRTRRRFFRSWFFAAGISLLLVMAPQSVPSAVACGTGSCEKLKAAGLSAEFIKLVGSDYDEVEARKIVELNVLGFLGKADYSGHFDHRAVPSTRTFLKKYRKTLKQVEKRYGVAKEVIAALLWVETKHGKYLGRLPVGQTYYSLVHADTPAMIEVAYQSGSTRSPAYDGLRAKIEQRASAKSAWAIEQLQALEKMHKRGVNIRKLTGSYAGAFGLPQFIPSSYLSWGKALETSQRADLYRPRDAIASVGNYLKSNGWNAKDPESQKAALYHYNRADGYVDVILKIASASK